jgi:hypothetical protein
VATAGLIRGTHHHLTFCVGGAERCERGPRAFEERPLARTIKTLPGLVTPAVDTDLVPVLGEPSGPRRG